VCSSDLLDGVVPGQTLEQDGCGNCGGCTACDACGEYKLFAMPCLTCRRIDVGGWLEQGLTFSSWNPQNNFNGPVTFNDRAGEYQMNQLYLYVQRKTDTTCRDWDVGGRIDFLYGMDYRFTTAAGLEDAANRGNRLYGLAIPQMYFDAAYGDLTVRMGHFYSIIGYEQVPAPNNFFYSHSYTRQYAMPFTHTGALGIYKLNDCWSFTGGITRGWDNWNDNNNNVGFLGGVNWTSYDKKTTGAFAVTVSSEDAAGENTRTMYDLYFTRKLGDRLTYVIEHALGTEVNGVRPGQSAAWFSVVNYLLYEVNPCWSFGLRYEWFDDQDGTRVQGIGGARESESPRGFVFAPYPADWNELSAGLNWKPNCNVIVRSELRWDWQNPWVADHKPPFNDQRDRHQFLWASDLIIKY
jgi:hypothetical protein